jgi:AcrR family transcriptional regulator
MIVDQALLYIATHGVRSLSLRKVTASVDRSTGAVFQTFAGRDELLCAVLEEAVRRDGAWHRQWGASLAGMRLDGASLSNIIADYLIERAQSAQPAAAVWRDAMFEGDAWPIAAATGIAAGIAVQTAFWRDLLAPVDGGGALPDAIVIFGVMESAYATILHDDIAYRLLLRATTSALVEQAMGSATADASAMMEWADAQVQPVAPVAPEAPLAARLLHAAATAIRQEGVAALNLRRIATLAQASPSAIAYHFGDLDSFSDRAIEWALNSDIPPALRPWTTIPRQDMDQTVRALAEMLDGADPTPDAPYRGFYIGYARILAQTCLLARQRPALAGFVRQARFLEGTGIYHASNGSWPAHWALSRPRSSAFAIWVKGKALERAVALRAGWTNNGPAVAIDDGLRVVLK